MRYRELLARIGIASEDNRVVESITTCHRTAGPTSLFVAIRGNRFDSNTVIPEVLRRGSMVIGNVMGEGIITIDNTKEALAILAEAFYGDCHKYLKIIGVTGTSGKSSVTYYITSLLRMMHCRVCMIGGDGVFMEEQYRPTVNTTPSSLFLSKTLQDCVANDIDMVVMEVSSHASEQDRVRGIYFDGLVFLNLGHDHLDYHSSFYQYKESKVKLLQQCKPDGMVLFAQDEEELHALVEERELPMVRFGFSACEYQMTDMELSVDGSKFCLNGIPVQIQLLSSVNVNNVAAAIATCHRMGFDLSSLCQAASKLSCLAGRLEVIATTPVTVIIDYAHTVEAFLELGKFVSMFPNRKWIVMGLGGDRDKSKRKVIGGIVAQYFDCLMFTSDNPRREDPLDIIADMCEDCGYERVEIEIMRPLAITNAITKAGNGDIIVIAGKGNEQVQFINNKQIPMNDKDEAKRALAMRLQASAETEQ